MRKLKGVIGAIIVVIALMSSVLAGYALNVNGSTEIVNGYEKVTDVSGLYSHSQEKTFIEYNPASNYIGYGGEKIITYKNPIPTGGYGLKNITSGTIIIDPTNETINVNGVLYNGLPTEYLNTPFVHDYGIIEGSGPVNYFASDGSIFGITDPITITINNDTTVIEVNGQAHTFTGNTHNLVYWTGSDYDYIQMKGIRGGNSAAVLAYIDDLNNILSAGNDGEEYQSHGTIANYRSTGTQGTIPLEKTGTQINGPVYQMNVNYDLQNDGKTYQAYGVYYPRFVYGPGLGIEYTESSRVNNYPIEYRETSEEGTQASVLDLQALSTRNYWTRGNDWIMYQYAGEIADLESGLFQYMVPRYTSLDSNIPTNSIHKYKLSDILTTMVLPEDTTKVSFNLGIPDGYNNINVIPTDPRLRTVNIFNNFTAITTNSGVTDTLPMPSPGVNFKITYYPATGICEIFDIYGVKKETSTPDNVYVQFVSAASQYGRIQFTPFDSSGSSQTYKYTSKVRPHPYLNVEISSQSITGTPVYMDPTKGIKIDADNVSNVQWNNEYENGNIRILFRAEETYSSYHNEFSISGNDIAIDYAAGRFSVTLNDNDTVDIGTWRNIILNVDLEAGILTAIPVRTFNSYTNVLTDNTSIEIGNLVNATTTNTIVWKPTPNSFRFSVYSTDVFLNTYNTVMVNPSLNVQQFFTQLNNFYRLELKGFTVVGDSLTINGITGSTSGQNITFNDQILSLKNLDVTYADGKVTVSDGSASVDLGEIQNTVISGVGAWYFTTQLDRGFTESKQIYTWDWGDFIFNNTQFCVIFIGLIIAGLIAGRRVSSFGVVDYALLGIAIAIALTTQVIA